MTFYRPILSAIFFTGALLNASVPQAEELRLQSDIIYEKPTMEELSKLFWSLEAVDVNKDSHIDNYLLINECDIYKEYKNNEFEWRTIRESTRNHLKNTHKSFTRRIEFMQPLYLDEYDFQTNSFKLIDEYVRPQSRRMEVLTQAHMANVCGAFGELDGYPKGLIVELTRPFGLEKIPVKHDKAQEYINKKLDIFNQLQEHQRTKKRFRQSRDAYLWIQVRVFGFNDTVRLIDGYKLNSVFAVLEGMEVYADRDRRDLLYREEYDYYNKPSDFEKKLHEQYQALLENNKLLNNDLQAPEKGVGLLHMAERIINEKKQKEEAKNPG